MMKTLIDTDILLEIIRRKDGHIRDFAEAYFEQFHKYTISSLTVMEVVRGLKHMDRVDQIREVMNVFTDAEIIAFGINEAELAGRIHGDLDRVGLPIGRIDPLIAATAILHELTLATGNLHHFERVAQLGYPLNLQDWRKPPSTNENGTL